MADTELWWIGSAALLAPYAISYMKAAHWEPQTKRLFAVGVSVALGVAAFITQHGISVSVANLELMAAQGTGVWALGQIVYAHLVSGTSLETKLAQTRAGLLPT
jgi:hypothetical protein